MINVELEKIPVEAKSRTLSAKWTLERPQDIKPIFGGVSIRNAWAMPVPPRLSLWARFKRRVRILMGRFTMEDALAEILAAEITAEIDRELLEMVKAASK